MTGLGIHAVCYFAVNALLIAIWILGGGDADQIPTYMTHLNQARQAQFWPIYVMLFWGVGLVIHAGVVLITLPRRLREQRQRRRARENIHRTVLGILDGTMLEGAAVAAIRAADGDQAAKRVKKQVRKARIENERHTGEFERSRVRADERRDRSERRNGSSPRPASRDDNGSKASGKKTKSSGGREWVAVMFTDIVDSTRINQKLGDEAWAKVLADHRSAVRECLAKHNGTEVGTQGDGFLLRFQSPDAAVACATALQRGWSTARVAVIADGDGAIPIPSVRIGIHAGEAMNDEDDLVGRVINLASRVTDVANEHEILVTEPLADHLTDDVKLVDRGLKTLKGFDRPRHLLSVVWQDSPEIVVLEESKPSEPSELAD